jgi:predicted nucleic acid-binding protein
MAVSVLADTGALLALLDRRDRWHQVCLEAFRQIGLPMATTEAVLTDLFHLVGGSRHEMEAAWKLLRSGAVVLSPISDSELANIHELMSRYADRPMDFADATLVYVAGRDGLTTVFTVDRADFETYRIEGRRKLRLLPAAKPKE